MVYYVINPVYCGKTTQCHEYRCIEGSGIIFKVAILLLFFSKYDYHTKIQKKTIEHKSDKIKSWEVFHFNSRKIKSC